MPDSFRSFKDRAPEMERIQDVIRTRGNLVLYGERRQGKTELLRRAREWVRSQGGQFVMVDLWTVTDLEDLVRKILQALPGSWLGMERASRVLTQLRGLAQLSVDSAGSPRLTLSVEPGRAQDPRAALEAVLRALDRIAEEAGVPVVLALDEFQAVEDLTDGGARLIRALAQESGDVAYLFAGSILRMVTDLLGPKGPLYGTESLEIGPIDPDFLASWIDDVLRGRDVDTEAGVGAAIVAAAGPITEHVVRLAEFAEGEGLRGRPLRVDGISELVADLTQARDGQYQIVWRHLHVGQQGVLRAIAAGETQLTAKATRERHALGNTQRVIYHRDLLRDQGLLVQSDPPRIADPFFEAWVRERALA